MQSIGKRGEFTLQRHSGESSAMIDVHGPETERIMLDLLEANEEVLDEWHLTEEPAMAIVE